MSYLSMAIFLVVVGIALVAAVVYAMAYRLLRPPRMDDGKALSILKRLSPADLGLPFEPMNFTVRDERDRPLRLAGWWIPAAAPSETTAVLIHGYADAKVGGIAWAPAWRSIGCNVLALDLRAHGESEGAYSTGGFFEQYDVAQIIDGLKAAKPLAASRVVLFGVSLGAAVACGVARNRGDIAGVVLESPFDDYVSAVRQWATRSSLPLPSLARGVCRAAEWISGADFATVRSVDLIPNIAAPLLVIHGERDDFLSAHQLSNIQAALATRQPGQWTDHAVFPEAAHNLALASDPQRYRELLAGFLAQCQPFTGVTSL